METVLKKTVTLSNIFHRDMNCIAVRFEKDTELMTIMRAIPERKFSKTMSCWYVENRKGLLHEIFSAFKGVAWVDITGLKKGDHSDGKSEKDTTIVLPVSDKQPNINHKAEISKSHSMVLRMMEQKLKLKGYSVNTLKTYLQQFKDFQKFYSTADVTELTEVEIRNYLLYLVENKKVSKSYQNQAINAIKFFYEKILLEDRKVYYLERPMKEKRLPKVLSQENLMAIFEAAENIKHRLMLMLVYAAGLRRSELLLLRCDDLDLDRNVVFIRGGKGRKDRQSIMAQSLIPLLREYLAGYSPSFWLFEGRAGDRYSESSLRQVLKHAVEKAGINKRVNLHMLRHSFATHLLEAGTSTRYIQELLGHESPVTTEIYAQVTRFGLDKIQSPLDQLAAQKHLRGDEK